MIVVIDHDALLRAQTEGALSDKEALALDALATTEEAVPEWLYDAIERLFLWCATDETMH